MIVVLGADGLPTHTLDRLVVLGYKIETARWRRRRQIPAGEVLEVHDPAGGFQQVRGRHPGSLGLVDLRRDGGWLGSSVARTMDLNLMLDQYRARGMVQLSPSWPRPTPFVSFQVEPGTDAAGVPDHLRRSWSVRTIPLAPGEGVLELRDGRRFAYQASEEFERNADGLFAEIYVIRRLSATPAGL